MKIKIYDIALVAVLAALVFAASWITFPIPLLGGATRIHLGNVVCLLAGLLLGGFRGGLAAGIGSMFFDFTNPLYLADAPFTLVFKFMMAFICGVGAWSGGAKGKNVKRNVVFAIIGALTYVVLHLGKTYITNVFVLNWEPIVALIEVGYKAIFSGINGVIAVVIAVPLAAAVRKSLANTDLYRKMFK